MANLNAVIALISNNQLTTQSENQASHITKGTIFTAWRAEHTHEATVALVHENTRGEVGKYHKIVSKHQSDWRNARINNEIANEGAVVRATNRNRRSAKISNIHFAIGIDWDASGRSPGTFVTLSLKQKFAFIAERLHFAIAA